MTETPGNHCAQLPHLPIFQIINSQATFTYKKRMRSHLQFQAMSKGLKDMHSSFTVPLNTYQATVNMPQTRPEM